MKSAIIAALIGALAIGGALGAFAATRTVETTANVEVRVWQRISDGALFLSTRPPEGDWNTTEAPLNMGELSRTGRFQQSSIITVAVPVTVEVEVPDAVQAEPTRAPPPAARPIDTDTPVAGPCCEVRGMDDVPAAQRQVRAGMQDVIEFALEEYGIAHTGDITLNIAHSTNGLAARYQDVFGRRLEELPSQCSFQEGEHVFIGPQCRTNKVALAGEWFDRAVGTGEVTPTWVGHGARDYFANHYATGDVPVITEDRFRRVVFYERVRNIRRDQASDDMKTLAMLYALEYYGDFGDWLRFYSSVLAGLDADAAFQSIFNATLPEFYGDLEEWADHQRLILISTAFPSCRDAALSISTQLGSVGGSRGFPDYRVPLEVDHDEDGVVCEGFVILPTPQEQ